MSARRRKSRRRDRGRSGRFDLESLEPRILFSADLPGLIGDWQAADGVSPSASVQIVSNGDTVGQAREAVAREAVELVFVDERVDDLDAILADLASSDDRAFEVYVLERDDDALARIGEVMGGREAVASLHLLSHGGEGALLLGDRSVDTQALLAEAESISAWAQSFTDEADILLYGCDVASDAEGRNFVETLGQLTRTDVAASDDVTGAGGDWQLEHQVGEIEAELAIGEPFRSSYTGSFATFNVTNLNDNGGGSLRSAIASANASGNPSDTIAFDTSLSGTISLLTALPQITNTVIIDATTVSAYAGAPAIVLDGSSTSGADGLALVSGSDGSTVRGLQIQNFDQAGILIDGSNNNAIESNYVGTDGSAAFGNGGDGIRIRNASGNVIGGSTSAQGNLVSGNGQSGIDFGIGATGNYAYLNLLGVDASASTAIGNTSNGLWIGDGATNNVVGGAGLGNVLSGNVRNGLEIEDAGTSGNVVIGNYIGTDPTGSSAIQNGINGVSISGGSTSNDIGGTGAGEGNVISGNVVHGVEITGSGTDSNRVLANFIGTDAAGTGPIANGGDGVHLASGASSNTIGDAAAGNVISGNIDDGVHITGSSTTNNEIIGNYIGTDKDGLIAIANGDDGVALSSGAHANRIGLAVSGGGNLISGNDDDGIDLDGSNTRDNTIQNNWIGVDSTGVIALANAEEGIWIGAGAHDNTVGASGADGRNIISGNGRDGIRITGFGTTATGNAIVNNYIGLGSDGDTIVANGANGVQIENGANGNSVGASGLGNVISGNVERGVLIDGTSGNTVDGNFIGTDATGTAARANAYGVTLEYGATANQIGTGGVGNLISGNTQYGVDISDSGTDGNFVQGNLIGTDATGAANLSGGASNGASGIGIFASASSNTIGGAAGDAHNVISGNAVHGILIQDSGTTGNLVLGNHIGTNLVGDAALANGTIGVYIRYGASGNDIGGTGADEGNLISGNGSSGVMMSTSGTTSNRVLGNTIGLNLDQDAALANGNGGVNLASVGGNTIGLAGAGNVVSGNSGNGIQLTGTVATGNTIQGNQIGTNLAGDTAHANSLDGIYLGSGAHANTIGGSTTGEGNLISGNGGNGLVLTGNGTDSNIVHGNRIGTDAGGTSDLGNVEQGVAIYSGAASNDIGGTGAGEGNLISGNDNSGIAIDGTDTDSNRILGNTIGLDSTGVAQLANGHAGVYIGGTAENNQIGLSGSGNVISGNLTGGIVFEDSGTSGNTVQANYIGTASDGLSAFGNGIAGVVLRLSATGNTIGGTGAGDGNLISGNTGAGVVIEGMGTSSNLLLGNTIGVSQNGTAALANTGGGVSIYDQASANRIGGGTTAERNVIAGNGGNGVTIYGSGTDSNLVQGNHIGTDAVGTAAIANADNGVYVGDGAQSNEIGGSTSGEGNLISGNTRNGVVLWAVGTESNLLLGNWIGIDSTGTAALANDDSGVYFGNGASNNTIGGIGTDEHNVISGNGAAGVVLDNAGTDGNTVYGNRIGTNASGNGAVGNTTDGVRIEDGASNNLIGGGGSGEGNLISGNGDDGVDIRGSLTNANAVLGNVIGTNLAGTADLGNGGDGIALFDGATNTRIGDSGTNEGNLIAGNDGYGISIDGNGAAATTGNAIEGNIIGLDSGGATALANTLGGVYLANGATGNTVGGDRTAGEGNVIAGHTGVAGISIDGAASTANAIQGNLVGTDALGTTAFANETGILITDAADTLIGGTGTGEGNLVSGNSADGIHVTGSGATDVDVLGNLIGTTLSGNVALANGAVGVLINGGAVRTSVGGTSAAARNVISANASHGVKIDSATDTVIQGNYLGLGADGSTALGNTGAGALITIGTDSLIGGTPAGAGNLIAHNGADGIYISGAAASGNTMLGNLVYSNTGLGIDLGTDGADSNDTDDVDTGANALQNTPVLSRVGTDEATTVEILGTLDGEANQAYRIEFFSSGTADASGHGEAETYLGYVDVTTDASGDAAISVSLAVTLAEGEFVTATATVDHGGGSYGNTSEFAANVVSRELNVAPGITSSATPSVAENTTAVTTVTSSDANADTVTYTITGGADAGHFAIDATTGAITFSAAPDFESPTDSDTDNVYEVEVTAADGFEGTDVQTISVTVTDVNEAPVITSDGGGATATLNVGENTTAVTTVVGTDVDALDTATYTITGGADSGHFMLNASTGDLVFSAAPDYETVTDADTDGVYEVEVTVTDGSGATDVQTLSVTVTDANDNAPVIDASQTFTVIESATNTTSVGTVTATDADTTGSLQNWTIQSGNTDNIFAVNALTGEITVSDNTNLDREATSQYTLTLTVGDGTNTSASETVTIDITDVNDNAPVIDASQTFSVSEGATNTTSVGTVTATDADTGTTLQNWQIIGGDTDNIFSVDANTGEITVADNTNLDREATSQYTLTLTVGDGTNTSASETVTIDITDVNDNAPTIDSTAVTAATEDALYSYTVTASDADGDPVTISATTLPSWLTLVDHGNGTATLSGTPTNAEVGSHAVVLETSDGTLSGTQTFSVVVSNTNDAPVITSNGGGASATLNVIENTTAVTTVTSTDVDAPDTATYSISGGADQGHFTLNMSTGVLSFNAAPDFEAPLDANGDNVYEVEVTVTDGSGATDVQTLSVTVTDANDNTPVIDLPQSLELQENQEQAAVASVRDADGDTVTLAISGGADAARFRLDRVDGVLSLIEAADYEAPADANGDNVYELELTATDAHGLQSTRAVALHITDVNEAPVIDLAEANASTRFTGNIGQIKMHDPDTGAVLNVKLMSGNHADAFRIDAQSGEITQLRELGPGEYTFEIIVVDEHGAETRGQLRIQILDDGVAYTSPIDLERLSSLSGPVIGGGSPIVSAIDVDTASTVSASSDIDSSTGETTERDDAEEGATDGDDGRGQSRGVAVPETMFEFDEPPARPLADDMASANEASPARGFALLLELIVRDAKSTIAEFVATDHGQYTLFTPGGHLQPEFAAVFEQIAKAFEFDEQTDDEERQQALQVGTVLSVTLTAGFVTWLLSTGSLFATAASTTALWKNFDPIPVLRGGDDEDERIEADPFDQRAA